MEKIKSYFTKDNIRIFLTSKGFIYIFTWLVFISFLIGTIAVLTASSISWGGASVMIVLTVFVSFLPIYMTYKMR